MNLDCSHQPLEGSNQNKFPVQSAGAETSINNSLTSQMDSLWGKEPSVKLSHAESRYVKNGSESQQQENGSDLVQSQCSLRTSHLVASLEWMKCFHARVFSWNKSMNQVVRYFLCLFTSICERSCVNSVIFWQQFSGKVEVSDHW